MKIPPRILPIVTGKTLIKILYKIKNESVFTNNPIGIKNMFATQCSKPQATKAIIGKKQQNIFEIRSFAINAIIIARTTNILQKKPLIRHSIKGNDNLYSAILTANIPRLFKLLIDPNNPDL